MFLFVQSNEQKNTKKITPETIEQFSTPPIKNKKEDPMKKYFILIMITFLLSFKPSHAEQNFSDVKIKTIPVAGSVYQLSGAGGNIGVSVGEDGILMVDDEFAPLANKIQSSIEALNPYGLKFLLNTHWHGDHTGSNKHFGKKATIIAHDNVRKRLSSKQTIKLFNSIQEPQPKTALPVITFTDSITIHFNNEPIDVIHFANGHTDGDSIIFFRKSNVVHMGDHFFNGIYPFIDLNTGGNVKNYINNIEKIMTMLPVDIKIIPGHGPLADLNDLKEFHAMLVESTNIIEKAIQQEKNLEEIKSVGLPESMVNKWGKGFLNTDQWIDIIYQSYSE